MASATLDGRGIVSATVSGGAIDADVCGASATLTGDRVDGNTAGEVGGAFLDYTTNGAQATGSTFDANQAGDGGAIAVLTIDQEILKDVALQDNRAADDGGGIYQDGEGILLTDIRVQGNTAQNQPP